MPPTPPHTTSGITPATTNTTNTTTHPSHPLYTTLQTLPPAPTPLLNAPSPCSHTRRQVIAPGDFRPGERARHYPYSCYTHPESTRTKGTDHSYISNHEYPLDLIPAHRYVALREELQRAARADPVPCPYTYSSYTHPYDDRDPINHTRTRPQPPASTTATAAQNETETDEDSTGRAGMFRYGRAPYVRGRDGGVRVAQEGRGAEEVEGVVGGDGEADEGFETWCRAQVLLREE